MRTAMLAVLVLGVAVVLIDAELIGGGDSGAASLAALPIVFIVAMALAVAFLWADIPLIFGHRKLAQNASDDTTSMNSWIVVRAAVCGLVIAGGLTVIGFFLAFVIHFPDMR